MPGVKDSALGPVALRGSGELAIPAVCQSLMSWMLPESEGATRDLWGQRAPAWAEGPGSWEHAGAWSCGSHLGPWALKALREPRAGGQGCHLEPLEGQVRDASGPGFLRGHRAWPGSGSAVDVAHSLRPPPSGSASLLRWAAAGRGEGLCPLPSNLPQYFCSSARCRNSSLGNPWLLT